MNSQAPNGAFRSFGTPEISSVNLGARLRGVPVRPRTLLTLTEVVLVGLLGIQAARLVWTFAAPSSSVLAASASAASPTAGQGAILARFDPFFRIPGAGSAAPDSGATSPSLQLYGVRVGPQGSAILGPPGGEQALYEVGEALPDGQVLSAVAADHVILTSGGARRRLDFPTLASLTPAPPPPPPGGATQPQAASTYSGAQLASAMALSPRMKDGRGAGYTITPRGAQGSAILAQAGLMAGDVILTVDGSELNAERFSELPTILAAADRVEIAYERSGQTLTTTLRMSPP